MMLTFSLSDNYLSAFGAVRRKLRKVLTLTLRHSIYCIYAGRESDENRQKSQQADRNKALRQQITLLEMKKEHLENLILFARGIEQLGVRNMDFS